MRLKADVLQEHCRVEEVYRSRGTVADSRADLLPFPVDIRSKRHMLSVSRKPRTERDKGVLGGERAAKDDFG